MLNLRKANEYTNKLFSTTWVQWAHEGTKPAETNLEKSTYALISKLSKKHCAMCLNLNGCCFVKEKSPKQPLHPNCHCDLFEIPSITVKADCPIEKITDYIFSDTKNNGKKYLFESWGYSIMDSEELKNEFEKNACLTYSVGEYDLGKLNEYGQRISIKIKLKRKNSTEFVYFLSGWMVYPNGKIVLTTPFGGKAI